MVTNNITIIGLAGKAGSGKSTIAKYLEKEHGYTRLALTDPLKLLVYKVFGFVHSKDLDRVLKLSKDYKIVPNKQIPDNLFLELMRVMQTTFNYNLPVLDSNKIAQLFMLERTLWTILKVKDLSEDEKARMLYQVVGTDLFRTLAPNIWVNLLEKRIKQLQELGYTKFIIDDVRFLNEVEKIRELGGKVGLVIREYINKEAPIYQHISEKALPEDPNFYDFHIVNNYETLDDLYTSVNKILLKTQ